MLKYIRWLIGLLLFIVLFKITKEHQWIGIRSFTFPINIFSERQNDILILLIFVCLISFPFLWRKLDLKISLAISAGPILYILFRTFFHFRQIVAGASGKVELLSLGFSIASIICVVALVRWIFLLSQDPIKTIAGIIFVVDASYLIFVCLQLATNPGPMYNSNRFYGLSNHPNQFAATLALMNTGALYFLIRSFIDPRKALISRIMSTTLILGNYGFIIVSGSRTGVATVIAATAPFLLFLFFHKPLATLVISSLVGLLLVGVFMFVATTNFDVYRIFSTLNTRDYIFSELWQGFLEYPLFGVPYVETHTSNSYLMALANVGLVGTIPFFLFLALDTGTTIKLSLLGNLTARARLEISFLTSTFFGVLALGFLDGFLLQVISFSQLFTVMLVVSRCCYIEYFLERVTTFRQFPKTNHHNRQFEWGDGRSGHKRTL